MAGVLLARKNIKRKIWKENEENESFEKLIEFFSPKRTWS